MKIEKVKFGSQTYKKKFDWKIIYCKKIIAISVFFLTKMGTNLEWLKIGYLLISAKKREGRGGEWVEKYKTLC